MSGLHLIHAGLEVGPLLAQIGAYPDLWNGHRERTTREATAHAGADDLWIRYFARESLREPADYNRPGECVFYPAWDKLTLLQPVVWGLVQTLRALSLGGILLTRLPPGGRIARHADGVAWHARHYNRKAYVVLAANARCVVECDGEEQVYRPGEIFLLDNLRPHSMENGGTTDRITLIVCMRVEE